MNTRGLKDIAFIFGFIVLGSLTRRFFGDDGFFVVLAILIVILLVIRFKDSKRDKTKQNRP